MSNDRIRPLGVVLGAMIAVFLLCADGAVNASGLAGFLDLVVYDASLGTLPADQGWSTTTDDPAPDDGLDDSNYSVAAGVLTQGATGGPNVDDGNRQWVSPPAFDYDLDRDIVIVDFRARVIESTSALPPAATAYAGFGALFADREGEQVFLYIAEGALFLLGTSGQASSVYTFSSTGSFHDYRLQIDASGASVLVDGITRASLPRSAFFSTILSNELRIGDFQTLARSSVEIESIRLGRGRLAEPGVREAEWVTSTNPVVNGLVQSNILTCPAGKLAIAGGVGVPAGARVLVTHSHPTGSLPYRQWFVRAEQRIAEGGPWTLRADVLCGEIPGQEFVGVSIQQADWDGLTEATCPASKVAISAGAGTEHGNNEEAMLREMDLVLPLGDVARVRAYELLEFDLPESRNFEVAAWASCSASDAWIVQSATGPSDSNASKSVVASCPAGMIAVGGGVQPGASAPPDQIALLESRPTGSGGPLPDGWLGAAEEESGFAGSWSLTTTVVCGWPVDATTTRRDLVGRWRADSGQPDDDLGRNPGVLRNGATIDPGLIDQAFAFERANEEWMEIPGGDFYFDDSFTVSAWIETDSLHAEQSMIASLYDFGGTNPSVSYATWILSLTPEGYPYGLVRPGSFPPLNSIMQGTQSVADGEMHHLTLIRDNDFPTRAHLLYVDGTLVASDPVDGGEDAPLFPGDLADPDPVSVGVFRTASSTALERTFDGLIDDVKFYDRALSQNELQNLVGCEKPILPRVLNIDAGLHGASASAGDGHRLCVFLEAGSYTLELVTPTLDPAASFTAWSPSIGDDWVTAYSAVGEIDPGLSGGSAIGASTAQGAFDATSTKLETLNLTADQRVYFSIVDSPPVLDNLGGVSISLPEPRLAPLSAVGALALMLRARGRARRHHDRRE